MDPHHGHDHGQDPSQTYAQPTAKHKSTMWAMAVDRYTAEVTAALNAAGVRVILLKGPAVVRWLYDEGAVRNYADADLMVGPDDLEVAKQVLRAIGFRLGPLERIPGDFPRHAQAWLRQGDSANVDLHQTLAGADAPPQRVWSVLSSQTEPLMVAGKEVTVLQPPARALMLALHAAKDAARIAKVRHDLGHAIERLPLDVWRAAADLAARIDAVDGLSAGLRSVAAGKAVAETLDLPEPRGALLALRAEGAPPLSIGLNWLLEERSVRRRASVVVRKIVPPPDYLRASHPIARRGRLGLAVAYVWRPVSLAVRVVPAARAARRARRAS